MKREKYSFVQIHKKLIKTIQNREPSKLRKISAVWMSSFWIATLNGDMASTKLMLLRRQAAADPVRGGRLTKPPTLKPPELQWNSSFLAENEPCDQFNYKKLKEGRTKLLWQWEEKTWKTCSCKQTTWLNLVGEEDLGWTLSEDSYLPWHHARQGHPPEVTYLLKLMLSFSWAISFQCQDHSHYQHFLMNSWRNLCIFFFLSLELPCLSAKSTQEIRYNCKSSCFLFVLFILLGLQMCFSKNLNFVAFSSSTDKQSFANSKTSIFSPLSHPPHSANFHLQIKSLEYQIYSFKFLFFSHMQLSYHS